MVLRMILTGALFACWPLMLNRSGLTGTVSTTFFIAVVFAIVATVTVMSHPTVAGAASYWWAWVLVAGCFSAGGMLLLGSTLSKVTPAALGQLTVILTVSQIAVSAMYGVAMSGWHVAPKTALGFVAAITAAVLLR